MKEREMLKKLKEEAKPFYQLEAEERSKEMRKALDRMGEGATTYETRRKVLKLMRGEY